MSAAARYSAGECEAVSTASTLYAGSRCARRNPIAGVQAARCAVTSVHPCTKLDASGVRFHDTASATIAMPTTRGRQRRSEKTRTASGIAAYRSRATFSPTADGTRYVATQTAR